MCFLRVASRRPQPKSLRDPPLSDPLPARAGCYSLHRDQACQRREGHILVSAADLASLGPRMLSQLVTRHPFLGEASGSPRPLRNRAVVFLRTAQTLRNVRAAYYQQADLSRYQVPKTMGCSCKRFILQFPVEPRDRCCFGGAVSSLPSTSPKRSSKQLPICQGSTTNTLSSPWKAWRQPFLKINVAFLVSLFAKSISCVGCPPSNKARTEMMNPPLSGTACPQCWDALAHVLQVRRSLLPRLRVVIDDLIATNV